MRAFYRIARVAASAQGVVAVVSAGGGSLGAVSAGGWVSAGVVSAGGCVSADGNRTCGGAVDVDLEAGTGEDSLGRTHLRFPVQVSSGAPRAFLEHDDAVGGARWEYLARAADPPYLDAIVASRCRQPKVQPTIVVRQVAGAALHFP